VSNTTFEWFASSDVAGVTGESLTSQNGAVINDVLLSTLLNAVTVPYTVTPTAAGCSGSAQTVTVTVNPVPLITSSNSTTICSGSPVGINIVSNVAGATFSWVATDNTSVTGFN
jgi:hypothetical protein